MIWEIAIDATPDPRPEDLADLLDELLSALEELPSVLGPVTSGNRETRWIGARFDFESPGFERAVETGIALFNRAAQEAGLASVIIQHVEITRVHELAEVGSL